MAFGKSVTQLPTAEPTRVRATTENVTVAPPQPLHVLLLEDSAADAELILHELRHGGYDPISGASRAARRWWKRWTRGPWQIVLLDYTLEGGGTALDTLASLAELDLDLPAILISGVIGEEEAADALRAGPGISSARAT